MATATKKDTYYEGVGRRKTSVARVRVFEAGRSDFSVNGKSLEEYFATPQQRATAKEVLTKAPADGKFKISVLVKGGGISSQSVAVRHGVARAFLKYSEDLRIPLKKEGFLTRDARAKERRKFGKKKARKSPQWSKR